MPPNRRHRIGGRSARRLAFGAVSARAVRRSMGRSRPNLQRCAGQLTTAYELSTQRYRSNGCSVRLDASGGSTIGEAALIRPPSCASAACQRSDRVFTGSLGCSFAFLATPGTSVSSHHTLPGQLRCRNSVSYWWSLRRDQGPSRCALK